MKLEDQVCSLDIAKRLKELGVEQESLWYYHGPEEKPFFLIHAMKAPHDVVIASAFTVAELGEMLPPFVTTEKYLCKGKPRFNAREEETIEEHCWHGDKEADARAKMLCYLIEQGLVKP